MTPVGMGVEWSRPEDFRRSGWLISVLLHSGALALALQGVVDLQPKREPAPFRWDVVLAPTPPPPRSPSDSIPVVQPPPTVPPQQAMRSKPVPVALPKPVERRVVERTAMVQPIQAAQTEQRPMSVTTPVEREVAVETAPPIHAEPVETSHPIQQLATQDRPMGEPIERVMVREAREATGVTQAIVQQEVQQVHEVEAKAMPVAVSAEGVALPHEVAQQIVGRPVLEPVEAITQPVPTAEPPTETVTVLPVPQRRVETVAPAKADFGWLAESLWKRIEDLKRYPSIARSRRWEGKVIVEAVIRHDGKILDCQIAQSSGHGVLDQDALTVLRRASPLPLKHPLGRDQVTILVPIAYRLAG